jgi:type IV pilus assembly protein PilQ
VDVRQQGQNLLIEFQKSSLPDSLRRKLDVTDFGTPVQRISTTQVGDKVSLLVEPRGNWEHSAYQADSKFVLEVRTQVLNPDKLTPGKGYTGDKLSLNFQNIEIRALLQVIADFTNFNIVTSESVSGNVTLRLKDVPWDQALDIILNAKGLDKRLSANVMLIAPIDELVAIERADLTRVVEERKLEPLKTQSFQLNYAKADALAKALSADSSGAGSKSGVLSERGQVLFDARSNQLPSFFLSNSRQIDQLVEEGVDPVAHFRDEPARQAKQLHR